MFEEPESLVDLSREDDFLLGDWLIRPSFTVIESSSTRNHVPYRLMQVLVLLSRNKGRVVSRDELLSCCWGRGGSDEAINRCIFLLRRLLKDEGAAHEIEIITVPKIGYALDVRRKNHAADA